MLPCWTWLLVVCLNTMQTEVRQRKRFCWLLSLLIPIFDPSILFVFCSENKKKKIRFLFSEKEEEKIFHCPQVRDQYFKQFTKIWLKTRIFQWKETFWFLFVNFIVCMKEHVSMTKWKTLTFTFLSLERTSSD